MRHIRNALGRAADRIGQMHTTTVQQAREQNESSIRGEAAGERAAAAWCQWCREAVVGLSLTVEQLHDAATVQLGRGVHQSVHGGNEYIVGYGYGYARAFRIILDELPEPARGATDWASVYGREATDA